MPAPVRHEEKDCQIEIKNRHTTPYVSLTCDELGEVPARFDIRRPPRVHKIAKLSSSKGRRGCSIRRWGSGHRFLGERSGFGSDGFSEGGASTFRPGRCLVLGSQKVDWIGLFCRGREPGQITRGEARDATATRVSRDLCDAVFSK